MNKNKNCPFKRAQIEIVEIDICDIIVTSPTGPDPFPGEDDEFGSYYWDN